MSGHSRFGASASHRWMRCPGSVQTTVGLPNPSSPAAAEGTMLHEIAACELTNTPHEYDVTDEQREVVSFYTNFVRGNIREDSKVYIEQKFKLPHHPEFWGTADAIVVTGNELHVMDLKAGRGVAVEADYNGRINPQLGFYALGACESVGQYKWDKITISIVQPRLGGVKSRDVTTLELKELADELIAAAALAEGDNPPFAAGSHCKFCLAAKTCGELRNHVYELARMDFDAVA